MAGKIKYNTDLENIYIGPNPGDVGGAIGFVLHVHNKYSKNFIKGAKDRISHAIPYKQNSFGHVLKYDNQIIVEEAKDKNKLVDVASEFFKK